VEGAIRKAMDHTEGPIFVEFAVEQEDNVYPMIPAGQTVNEIIDVPDPVGEPTNGSPNNQVMTLLKGQKVHSIVGQKP
jgi:hypothetical protein